MYTPYLSKSITGGEGVVPSLAVRRVRSHDAAHASQLCQERDATGLCWEPQTLLCRFSLISCPSQSTNLSDSACVPGSVDFSRAFTSRSIALEVELWELWPSGTVRDSRLTQVIGVRYFRHVLVLFHQIPRPVWTYFQFKPIWGRNRRVRVLGKSTHQNKPPSPLPHRGTHVVAVMIVLNIR